MKYLRFASLWFVATSQVWKFKLSFQIFKQQFKEGNQDGQFVEKVKNFKDGQSWGKPGENDPTGLGNDTKSDNSNQSENNI